MPLPRRGFQRISGFGFEIAVVLVDVDPGEDARQIQFGVELGRVGVGADPEGLHGAVGR